MGGFIYVDGKHESVLDFDAFRRLPGISFPTISSAEICDKARGDFLLKAIAILQSLWFIIQCVARSKQGLALTELELLTLALGSLNGVMYLVGQASRRQRTSQVVSQRPRTTKDVHRRRKARAPCE